MLKGIERVVVSKLLMVKEKINSIVGEECSWVFIMIVEYINKFLMMVKMIMMINRIVVKNVMKL